MKWMSIPQCLRSLLLFALLIVGCAKDEIPPSVATFSPDFGPEGTLVTVEGMDFNDLLYINFNDDVPADFNPSFGTGEALLFRVPEGAPLGENQIRIGTEGGETSFNFRVTLEAPEVDDFNPKSANEGELVSITGKKFYEPLVVLFVDSIAGNIIYHQEDSLVVEVPAGVERGRIKVKANGGEALTGELFFSTTDILINDFDGNGMRSETNRWFFYGNINENASNAIRNAFPDPIKSNFLKISGRDPGTVWIGGTESHANDIADFDNFGITSDINNTSIRLDLNANGRDHTHLIIVLTERDGSPNDFSQQIHLDWEGWRTLDIPLNRFQDLNGATVDPAKIKNVKLHLFNEEDSNFPLEANIDNLKFIQIN